MNTILITGCNRGIGLEFVRQYALDGWEVHACCRNPAAAKELNALGEQHPSVSIHVLDVTVEEQIQTLARQLREIKLDVLLNNAGLYGSGGNKFGSIDKADWLKVFEINTIAPLLMAQAFLDHVQAGDQKIIATVSSKMGSIEDNTSGGSYAYRSSKTAVNQVMKGLAHELHSKGIKTVALHPGWVKTDMGGPNALINTEQSVTGMRNVLAGLTADQSGTFIGYDGASIPW